MRIWNISVKHCIICGWPLLLLVLLSPATVLLATCYWCHSRRKIFLFMFRSFLPHFLFAIFVWQRRYFADGLRYRIVCFSVIYVLSYVEMLKKKKRKRWWSSSSSSSSWLVGPVVEIFLLFDFRLIILPHIHDMLSYVSCVCYLLAAPFFVHALEKCAEFNTISTHAKNTTSGHWAHAYDVNGNDASYDFAKR